MPAVCVTESLSGKSDVAECATGCRFRFWAAEPLLHKLVSFGDSPDKIVPHLLVMTLATFVVGWITTRRFQFQ